MENLRPAESFDEADKAFKEGRCWFRWESRFPWKLMKPDVPGWKVPSEADAGLHCYAVPQGGTWWY